MKAKDQLIEEMRVVGSLKEALALYCTHRVGFYESHQVFVENMLEFCKSAGYESLKVAEKTEAEKVKEAGISMGYWGI